MLIKIWVVAVTSRRMQVMLRLPYCAVEDYRKRLLDFFSPHLVRVGPVYREKV